MGKKKFTYYELTLLSHASVKTLQEIIQLGMWRNVYENTPTTGSCLPLLGPMYKSGIMRVYTGPSACCISF